MYIFREKVREFLDLFEEITQEEADFIEDILKWDDEKRAAFLMAKSLFEEKDER